MTTQIPGMIHRDGPELRINGIEDRISALEQRLGFIENRLDSTVLRTSSTLRMGEVRVHVYWAIPDGVDTWIDDSLSVAVRIGVDDLAGAPSIQRVEQHPGAKHAEFVWRNVGIESAGTWWLSAAMEPTSFKIDKVTYWCYWNARRKGHIPEDERDVNISLARPVVATLT